MPKDISITAPKCPQLFQKPHAGAARHALLIGTLLALIVDTVDTQSVLHDTRDS